MRWTACLGNLAAAVALMAASAASASEEAWRRDWRVLRVGVVSTGDPDRARQRLEPFREAMEEATGITVQVVPSATVAELVEAQARLRVHYAIYTASGYATASVACGCVTAIAAPRATDGSTGFHAVMLAVPGSGVRALPDLKGLRVALGRKGSITGDLFPLSALADAGLAPGPSLDVMYAGGPAKAVAALAIGKADAAAAWSSLSGSAAHGYSRGTLRELVIRGEPADRYAIIWRSARIPHGPHAVHHAVPEPLRALLARFLTGLAAKRPEAYAAVERHYGSGFAEIGHADYQALINRLTLRGN